MTENTENNFSISPLCRQGSQEIRDNAMSENITTATRTCTSCLYKPCWAPVSPTSKKLRGDCRAKFSSPRSVTITLDGKVPKHEETEVTDCLAWEPIPKEKRGEQ